MISVIFSNFLLNMCRNSYKFRPTLQNFYRVTQSDCRRERCLCD